MGLRPRVFLLLAGWALVALALTRHAATFGLYYVSTGGLVGWQPGVISFVFLYTFRVLERRRG